MPLIWRNLWQVSHVVFPKTVSWLLVVGRESMVRGIPLSNSRILLELSKCLCSYEQATTSERVFTNCFGKSIKEDILILKKITPT